MARRESGFSLVELMVALVAGLIVSTALVAFTMSSFRSNSGYVLSTRLTQELRNTLDLVVRDVRRAGYNEASLSLMGSGSSSPFAPMKLDDKQADGTYQCILYAYDRAGGNAGSIDVDNGEVRGIRRVVVKFKGKDVGVVEYAQSANGTRPACDGATADYTTFPPACNATSDWCALSDPSILDISALALTDSRSTAGTAPTQVVLRDIGVSLTGSLASDSTVSRNVSTSVRIRSDCYDATISNCDATP